MSDWDALWINANLVTLTGDDYGLLGPGALAVKNGKIVWLGAMHDLPLQAAEAVHKVYDVRGRCLTPGFIDCHTHLVYAGNRAGEFEQRLNGMSYEAIAKAGGGIRSTVTAVRSASREQLLSESFERAKAMLLQGVTTVEIKSGYGLDLASELKMLQVAKAIGDRLPLTVCPTFLGAHALPVEYEGRADDYITLICEEILPAIIERNLATAVDAFCETIGFSVEQVERVFKVARSAGLNVKLHAEQLSDLSGAELAARYQALSADHLEYVSERGVDAMAKAGVVAVLLPGAYYFLRETKKPPFDWLKQYRVPIALATDCNPGSSPTTSLLLMLNMACTLWQMTPLEALQGVTMNAAQALGLSESHGSLALGKQADLVEWDVAHPCELAYQFGSNPCHAVYKAGERVV